MAYKKRETDSDAPVCSCNVIHDEAVRLVRENMPSDGQFQKLSMFFKAISDETRIKLLCSLSLSRMCVCDLAAALNMTVSAVSHQLRILRQAQLVKCEKEGKVVYYSLSDDHVTTVFNNAFEHISE